MSVVLPSFHENYWPENCIFQPLLASFSLCLLVLGLMKQKHEQHGNWNKNFISLIILMIILSFDHYIVLHCWVSFIPLSKYAFPCTFFFFYSFQDKKMPSLACPLLSSLSLGVLCFCYIAGNFFQSSGFFWHSRTDNVLECWSSLPC